ncbi:protein associated with RNAse G/E [Pullulanibacillus pueri]|uniref:UPF0374 protein n=1 Tax=Pullulanibacillus pueri TaxID=1437324 RepID=A0A8J2ZYY9_9BACL|nr:DUF402 domain-containing protein [Pullulanibacillus pueri]MBM7680698.1 protein associated with RNAse G/E [Pullulanibacillus pueri]GGH87538.1 UPF0374 protein [Pullulanibacillus pueri]
MSVFNLPKKGDKVKIMSYKHNGHVHRIWDETLVLHCQEDYLIGGNHETLVTESSGKSWRTKGSAIVYFSTKHWFNVIALLYERGTEYYCNIATPAGWDGEALTYIDYDLDLSVKSDGSVTLLDEDEFTLHQRQMNYPKPILSLIDNGVRELRQWITEQKGLFNQNELEKWSHDYQHLFKEN